MAERMVIDPSKLTLGELREIEQVAGRPFAAMLESIDAQAMIGLVYVMRRRADPEFTVADAENLTVAEVELEFVKADPTGGGSSPSSPPSATSGA